MRTMVTVVALSFLLTTALSAPVKEESLFHGHDFHIPLTSLAAEVTFLRTNSPQRAPEAVLMRGGNTVGNRARLNEQQMLLMVENVTETDEGIYTVKNQEPNDVQRIALIVRDCTHEQIVKYGDDFHIQLKGVFTTPPERITLEYKPRDIEANQTHKPAQVLLTAAGEETEGYQNRIIVNVNNDFTGLFGVTGADEGSYTVRDNTGVIIRKVCLDVKEHHIFLNIPYGGKMKFKTIINSSTALIQYIPASDPKPHILLDKGEFTSALASLGFEGRLSLEGSEVILEQVTGSDAGDFKITDMSEFVVANVYLKVEPYRLPAVYVAIIALLGLLAFLLLVCLLSCLYKVKKRAKRAADLEKIAQNAGKDEEAGDGFRQVVKNITQLNEDSKHSQAENTEKSQSTEVDIKGLEVSSKEVGNNLETSDSGVGFNTTALPLDTDTEAGDQMPESEAVSISIAPDVKASPPTAETQPSAPPAAELKPSPVAEKKASPVAEPKKTPDLPAEPTLDVPKPADVRLSPIPSPVLKTPEVKLSPSPIPSPVAKTPDIKLSPIPSPVLKPPPSPISKASPEAKTPELKAPAPSPSPEPKPSSPLAPSPKAVTPSPEPKAALAVTPEPPKPTTPEPVPISNGTPEPAPESKLTPEPADLIGGSAQKAIPAKTPELDSASPALESKADGPATTESTTT